MSTDKVSVHERAKARHGGMRVFLSEEDADMVGTQLISLDLSQSHRVKI